MPEIKPIKLSQSRLSTFIECPRCFWMDMHGKLPPTSPLPGILNRMDAIMKGYYDNYRNRLPPTLKGKVHGKLVNSKICEMLRNKIRFEDKKLNAILSGKFDDCLVDSRGRYIPIDNKTAKPNEEWKAAYQLQLDVYTLLLQLNNFKTAGYGYLAYYMAEKGDPVKGVIFKTEIVKLKTNPARALRVFREAVKLSRNLQAAFSNLINNNHGKKTFHKRGSKSHR